MSLFTAGREMLDSVFEANADYMKYRQGETVVVLLCKAGRTVFRTDDFANAVSIRTDARDFICRAADLGLTPQKGDSILWFNHTYTVYAPSGEPCWREHTSDAAQIRIHALQDDNVTPFPDGAGD